MLEKQIEKKVCEYAESLGWLQYKFKSANHKGVPDRIFMKNGKVVFIEFKAKGKKPTKLQFRVHRQLNEKAMTVTIVDSVETGKHFFNVIESLGVSNKKRTLRDVLPKDELGTPPLELEMEE